MGARLRATSYGVGGQATVTTDEQPPGCPLCGLSTSAGDLAEVDWLTPDVLDRLAHDNPGWRREDGACPACVQQALLHTLLEQGEAALHAGLQARWPIDAETAFGALPTPLRLHADPRFTGRGITLAVIDSAFYPHPDLTQPHNRIRAWVDAGNEWIVDRRFRADERPEWPGWRRHDAAHWHGLMTSVVAAGNGWLSHGLYRGLASEAELVLVQVRDRAGRITNRTIARALNWLSDHGLTLGLRVINLSVAGDPVTSLKDNPVDDAVARLVAQGITVVAAAGNAGQRRLLPPATAPAALTIGGLDDKNTFDHREVEVWHGNYGEAVNGALKPELVAPSLWVVAPVLPGSDIAIEAGQLFAQRVRRDAQIEQRLTDLKLVTPYYQHVDGTSFAAPLVTSVVACLLQAVPSLTPAGIRQVLIETAQSIPGASLERQGAGAVNAGLAIAQVVADQRQELAAPAGWLEAVSEETIFQLYDSTAYTVQVMGSWNGWQSSGLTAVEVARGVWQADRPRLPVGSYTYKFLLDGERWLPDPANPLRVPDPFGGWNSVWRCS